jgi:hypothetical protein
MHRIEIQSVIELTKYYHRGKPHLFCRLISLFPFLSLALVNKILGIKIRGFSGSLAKPFLYHRASKDCINDLHKEIDVPAQVPTIIK